MSSEGSRRRCITRCNTQWSPLPSTTDDDVAAVRRFGLLRAAPSRRRHTGGGVAAAAAAAFCLLLLLFATWPAPSVAHSWGKLAGLPGSRSVAFFGRPGSIHGVEEVAVDMSINNNNNEDEDEKCDPVAARDAVLRRPDDVAAYEVRHAHRKHVASWDGGIAEEEAGALQRRLGTVIPCTIHSTARADDDARRGVQRRPRQFLDSLVVT